MKWVLPRAKHTSTMNMNDDDDFLHGLIITFIDLRSFIAR